MRCLIGMNLMGKSYLENVDDTHVGHISDPKLIFSDLKI